MSFALAVLLCATLCGAVPVLELRSWLPIPDASNRFLPFLGTADKIAWDDQENYLYVIGTQSGTLHIVDLMNHSDPRIVFTRVFSEIQDGIPQAIAFCRSPMREQLVIAFSAKDRLNAGHVEVFKPFLRFDETLTLVGRVATEADPSAVKFDSYCFHFVVACEGRPGKRNNAFEDPLSHVDVFEPQVNGWTKFTINFQNARGLDQARYVYKDSNDPDHSILNDLEPSDLAIDDNNRVYVIFHENNAIAKFDLDNLDGGVDIYSLGTKDWNNFDIDTSDKDNAVSPGNDNVNLVRRNIRSFYQAKNADILHFNNSTFLVTANTGAYKAYTTAVEGVAFNEAERARLMNDSLFDPNLDATTKSALNNDAELGRLFVSTLKQPSDGWDPLYGYFKHAYAYGGRSWSMWNADGVNQVYDSGSDLEYEVSQYSRSVFNGDCFSQSMSPPQHLDTRSDDMGPEPSAIATGMYHGQKIVAVASGRMGGIWLYSVAEGEGAGLPTATFLSYIRLGDINGNWRTLYDNGDAGVQYISDLLFVNHHDHEMVIAVGSQMGAIAFLEFEEHSFP
ncbi:mesenchyme-specific cell surface glycoprotein-like [Haliotis asinina]|uniref:mesenchyme-specific cell surface glycoprotein-like n=1 Tax=Haliotis asinina TaxID=109174 RepID=UPI0035326B5A